MTAMLRPSKPRRSGISFRILALEPRMMFDGAAVGDVADKTSADSKAADTHAAAATATTTTDTSAKSAAAAEADKSVATATVVHWTGQVSTDTTGTRNEVVVVDTTVADWQTLVAGINPNTPVILLSPNGDGMGELEVLAKIMSQYHDLDAIHLVAEGRTGAILLGKEVIWSGDMTAASPYLATIGGALRDGGDFMLYSCSVAGSDSGKTFIDSFARALGDVDVAASTDRTGPTRLGGDWDLEYRTGDIETVLPFTLAGMQDISHCLGCHAGGGTTGLGNPDTIFLDSDNTQVAHYSGGIWYADMTLHDLSNGGAVLSSGGFFNSSDALASVQMTYIAECGSANTAPTVTAGASSASYTENGTAVVVDNTITVTDAEQTDLTGATAVISTNFVTGDVLNFTTQNGISGIWNGSTHTLTLSGTATLAQYQAALRSITFSSSSEVPTNANRTITWTVNDGQGSHNLSTGVTSTVHVTSVNDAPTGTPSVSGTTQVGQTLTGSAASVADLDGLGTFSYQWQSSSDGSTWNNISGATSTTYSLQSAENGKYVRLKVSYTDGGGTAEAVYSSATAAVTAPPSTTVTSASLSDDTGSSATDWITSYAASQTISGSLSAALIAGEHVEVSLDNVHWYDATVIGTDFTYAATLSGTGTFKARVTNPTGSSTAFSHSFTLDTTAPTISAASVPASTMKVGDTVTVFLTVGDDGGNAYTLGSSTVDGFALSNLTRVDSTHYTAQFTVTEGGTDVAAAADIATSIVLTDLAGNSNAAYTTAISQAGDAIDAHKPVVTAVSVPNSAMKVGDTVTATITVSSDADTLSLTSGTIGGFALSNLQKVNATTYTAQFTVTNGGTDVAAGADIPVNLVLHDSAGNASTAYTTAISQAGDAIDANKPVVSAVSVPASTMKIGDTVTATLTVSNDGGDTYTLGTSSIDGFALSNLVRVNATTYTAQFTVTSGGTDVAAASNIPVSIVLNDGAGNASTAFTTAITQAGDAIDANRPVVSNVTLNAASYKVGDTITATITVASDTDTGYTINTATIGGHTFGSLTRVNATTWTATYAVQSGDTDLFAGNPAVNIVLADGAGNQSTAYTTAIAQATTIDGHAPTDIGLSAATSALAADSTIGSLSATDTNSGSETFTYSLPNGVDDNNSFAIAGTTLKVGAGAITAGPYTVTVRVTDAGGNTFDKQFTITAANTPAVTSINRAGTQVTQGTGGLDYTVTFNQTVDGVDASDFAVVKGAGITGTAVVTVTAGSDGASSYTVHVAGLSGDGTVELDLNATSTGIVAHSDGTTAILTGSTGGQTYTLDNTAPAAPSGLTVSDDSGTSSTDGLTNDNTLVISGTAEANSTVEVFKDGVSIGTTTANGSGAWSYDYAGTTLAEGTYVFTAKATDTAGNTGAASSAKSVTVDTTAPAAPSTPDMTAGSDTGVDSTDNVTTNSTPTFTGTAEVGATVTLYDSDHTTVLGSATADDHGNWSITTSALSVGTHTVTAKATDAAGNTGVASSGLEVQIVTGPAAPTGLAVSSDTGSSSSDGVTSAASQTISGSAPAGATVLVFKDGTQVGTVTADGSGAWSYATGTLADGTHVFTAKARASQQDSAASSALSITVDTVAPNAPVVTGLGNDDGSSTTDGVTTNRALVVNGTAEAHSTVEVFKDGVSLGTATANGSGVWTYTTATLAYGNHVFTAKATDAAGNTSAVSSDFTAKVTTDSTAPAAPTLTTSGGGTSTAVTVSGTAEAGATVKLYDGGILLATVTADGGGIWTYPATLEVGTHTLIATATDAAGNLSATSGAVSVTINSPPVNIPVPIPEPPPTPQVDPVPGPVAPLVTAVREPTVTDRPADMQTVVRTTPITTTNGFGGAEGPGTVTNGVGGGGLSGVAGGGFAPGGDGRTTGGGGTFQVALAGRAPGGGDALVVNTRVPDSTVSVGERLSVTIPSDAFAHTRADATVTLTATRGDGAALPGWMTFNPRTGTFEGTPPPNFRGEVVVKVTARDNDGRQVVQTFKIVVGEGQGAVAPDRGQGQPGGRSGALPDQGGVRLGDARPTGRAGLTEQLRQMSFKGGMARHIAMFDAIKRGDKVA